MLYSRKMRNLSLYLLFLFILLLLPSTTFGVITLVDPTNGAPDVELDAYFQWEEVVNAERYVLDISGFTSLEDGIHPRLGSIICGNAECEIGESINNCSVDCSTGDPVLPSPSGSVCSGGVCAFGFLKLSIGELGFSDSYTWNITAYDVGENLIDASPSWTFFTIQEPTDTIPPPDDSDTTTDDSDSGPGPVDPPASGIFKIENPISSNSLPELIGKLLNFIFGLSIVIAPLMVLYAGFLMLTAAGDSAKIQKARSILIWTVVAFAIILVAKGAPEVIRSIL